MTILDEMYEQTTSLSERVKIGKNTLEAIEALENQNEIFEKTLDARQQKDYARLAELLERTIYESGRDSFYAGFRIGLELGCESKNR